MGDLQQIRDRQDQVTDETLESTRRIRDLALEANEAGIKTTNMLNEQGEKLDNIERGLDQIGEDITDAQKHLKEMEKPMWRFILCECCGTCGSKSGYDKKSSARVDNKIVQNPPVKRINEERAPVASTSAGGSGHVQRITNDAREDEMEENLDLVGNLLGNMRNIAIDMGDNIEKQNLQLDRMTKKAENNEGRVTDATNKTQALLNK